VSRRSAELASCGKGLNGEAPAPAARSAPSASFPPPRMTRVQSRARARTEDRRRRARSIYDPGGQHHWGRPAALLKTPCTVRGMRGAAIHSGRRARRRPAPEGSQGRGARPRMSWGVDMWCAARGPSSPRPYCSKATILGSLEPKELAADRLSLKEQPSDKAL
jgi:hypothetical protein